MKKMHEGRYDLHVIDTTADTVIDDWTGEVVPAGERFAILIDDAEAIYGVTAETLTRSFRLGNDGWLYPA